MSEYDVNLLIIEDLVDLLVCPTEQFLIKVPEIHNEQNRNNDNENLQKLEDCFKAFFTHVSEISPFLLH